MTEHEKTPDEPKRFEKFEIAITFIVTSEGETREERYFVTEPPQWVNGDWIQLRRGDGILAEFQANYLLGWERVEAVPGE